MSLLVALRGRLENMTNIENWWKEEAQKKRDTFASFQTNHSMVRQNALS